MSGNSSSFDLLTPRLPHLFHDVSKELSRAGSFCSSKLAPSCRRSELLPLYNSSLLSIQLVVLATHVMDLKYISSTWTHEKHHVFERVRWQFKSIGCWSNSFYYLVRTNISRTQLTFTPKTKNTHPRR